MKIIYSTDNYWPRVSGMAVSIDNFRRGLSDRGDEVHLFAPDYPGSVEEDRSKGRDHVHRLKARKVFFSPEDRLVRSSQRHKLEELMRSIGPDVIHVQTEFTMGRLTWEYARSEGIPLVMTCHTYFEEYLGSYLPFIPNSLGRWYARSRTRRTFDLADVVVAPTENMVKVLRGYGVKGRIEVIPTGMDPGRFSRSMESTEEDISGLFGPFPELEGKRVLLTVGRIGKEKNLDFLVRATYPVLRNRSDVHWVIVGDGPYRVEMEKKVISLGVGGRATFTGYVDDDLLNLLYGFASVFVFASKTESQGLVTLEAMMSGTPVVAVGEMGTRDVMGGDNGGFMVPEDEGIFSRRVTQLLDDEGLWKAKSTEARCHSKSFTIESTSGRMRELYLGLLEAGPQKDIGE